MSSPTQSTPQSGIRSTCQTNSTDSTPQPDSTPQTERQPTTNSDSTVQEAVVQPKKNSRVTSDVWNDKMNSALFIAILFDPRGKEAGLKFILESLFEKDELVSSVCKKVREDLGKLYEEYRSIYSTAENVSNVIHANVTPTVVQEDSIEAIMNSRKKRHRKSSDYVDGKSEVDRYLLDECEPADEKFDILAWWQMNSPKYKILSYTARDILVIPVSSVASESTFSTGKRILGPWRSSLSARTVEALLCTQSWLQKPIDLDFLSEYLPDEPSSIEEEILGPLPGPTNFEED